MLGQPCFELCDPHGLLLDDGEQLDDHLAHDWGRLFPVRAVKWKPCWQWDRSRHRAPSCHTTGGIAVHLSYGPQMVLTGLLANYGLALPASQLI
jgi:hypothetical protein